jgi:hypothetical protein
MDMGDFTRARSFLKKQIANHRRRLSNSNSLANQLGIYIILAKQENLPPTVWQTNLAKIETWQNSPPHAHICARGSWLPSLFPSGWEGEKVIKNREGILM